MKKGVTNIFSFAAVIIDALRDNDYVIAFDKIDALFIAPDKYWRQLGFYPPLFGLIGYFKF